MSYIPAVESRDVFVAAAAAAVAVGLGYVYARLRNDSAGRIVGHCDDGTVIGLFAAWFGGLWDGALMRSMDVFLAFPAILLAMLIVAIAGPGMATSIATRNGMMRWPTANASFAPSTNCSYTFTPRKAA